MGLKTLQIVQHDLQPYYFFQVKDSNGVVNITGATIRTTMKDICTGTLKINRATDRVIVTDAVNGLGELRWQSGDTNVLGTYAIEFEITPGSGGKFTVPTRGQRALIQIVQSLDTS